MIVSRLAADGIAARIDRGLYGSYQVPMQGQIAVLVDARMARRAHRILGTEPAPAGATWPLRAGIAIVTAALLFGLLAVIFTLVTAVAAR